MTKDRRSPRRIAIVRLTSLGDVIHTLPMAAAIRSYDPAIRIIWLAEEREQVLLRDNPVVDEVVTIPLRRWRNQAVSIAGLPQAVRELRALLGQLRLLRIDVAIDVQGWPHKSSPLAWITRAPVRVGFVRGYARHPLATLFTTHRITPPRRAKHIVDRNLALLEPLQIYPVGEPRFPLPAFAEAQKAADAWLRAHGVGETSWLVAVLPSTRGGAKMWPAALYRELAGRLLMDPEVVLLILGGPGEEALLEEVRRGLPAARALAWAPRPIPELVATLRRAQLVIGNDTGPLHVAAAAGVPSLGLFGPTNGERNGPYGSHGAFVQSATGRMADISVDEVVKAAKRLPRRPAVTTAS